VSRNRNIIRLIFVGIVLCIFVFAASNLYIKQRQNIDFLSFTLEEPISSFIVPDIDRLIDKIDSSADLEMSMFPAELDECINSVSTHKNYSFNREIAKDCFISYTPEHFVIVFNTTTSVSSLADEISDEFGVNISREGESLQIGSYALNVKHVGNYLAISNTNIYPQEGESQLEYGNADYVVFKPENKYGIRHILSKSNHFRIWENESVKIKGAPVYHETYFDVAPSIFDQIVFYGSSRISEDDTIIFNNPNEESFDWLNDGLMYVRNDSFEILIAKQGENRDLGLMLEEQTLALEDDSIITPQFNIGKFKVLPFKTSFNWDESVKELGTKLCYYTEFKQFNVLANSIPALRWYIAQIQLGKMFKSEKVVYENYISCLPEKAHYIKLNMDEDNVLHSDSKIYKKNGYCLYTEVAAVNQKSSSSNFEIQYDFMVDIVPNRITAVEDQNESEPLLLLNNLNQLALYDVSGNKRWELKLSSKLVDKPQIVDFENDGIKEFVLFQENQLDVINIMGKSLSGFPINLSGSSRGGLAVNYDNLYKYRLIVNIDNKVVVYSESGEIVEGWKFSGMSNKMKGRIYHVLTAGKDIITFKDMNDQQYVLNRRGENRIEKSIVFSLPNETDFLLGGMQSSLRKMGYKDGYIYNYYILDGMKDSIQIDTKITPIKTYWEQNNGHPLLIVEEPNRLLIVDEFGYVKSEVLKPGGSYQFVGLVGKQDFGFVFADNSQNSIYLLNSFGKMMLPIAVEGSAVCLIDDNLLYSFSGINIKAYKIID
jgi:hypothetical protein